MSSTYARQHGSTPGAPGGRSTDRPLVVLGADDLLFLAQLDHDLRTPLGTMAAALELLRGETPISPSHAHAEAVAVLQRQVARLHSLTASLHDFSQRLGR